MSSTNYSQDVPQNNVFSAFGAVLGYLGAEAATPATFERLLWPQRFYSSLTVSTAPKLALFMSMGGPLHKAALRTLDIAFGNGLFKGAHEGHMLGTAFFREDDWTYTMQCKNGALPSHTEPLRNCIWARALTYLPMPMIDIQPNEAAKENLEKGSSNPDRVRAKVSVSHLVISKASYEDRASDIPFVCESVGTPGPRLWLALFITELTGVLMAVGITLIFHSFLGDTMVDSLDAKTSERYFTRFSRTPHVRHVSCHRR